LSIKTFVLIGIPGESEETIQETIKLLEETQLMARMKMLECFQQGKMNVLLVQAFEEVLYKLYK
jgi:hypothetical protein